MKNFDGSECCDECFSTSQDVQRGHVLVAIPEGCKDEECECHEEKTEDHNDN